MILVVCGVGVSDMAWRFLPDWARAGGRGGPTIVAPGRGLGQKRGQKTGRRKLGIESREIKEARDVAASLEELERQARALNAEEQPVSAEEIENRVAAFDRGSMRSYAAEDVFAEARRLSR